MQKEIWKDITGYEGLYQVSNLGNVKSLGNDKNRKEKILRQTENKSGYLRVTLCKDGKPRYYLSHRLVANVFIKNEAPLFYTQVNHKDENKTNNRVENLEFCDAQYNNTYGSRIEKCLKPVYQFTLDGTFVNEYPSMVYINRKFGFGNGSICKCCTGKIRSSHGFKWSHSRFSC